jgi:DNA-binding XRE family transcriptional regulator
MKVQMIEKDGQPEWAVIPYQEYQQLLELKEEFEDIQEFDAALAMPQEKIPVEWVDRLLNGEHPISVWREYRGLTQQQLATHCAVDSDSIGQLEMRQCQPSLMILRKMANILKVDIEDLLEEEASVR